MMRWLALTLAAVGLCTATASADVTELTKKIGGSTVHYKVVRPPGYDPNRAYPAILAFGGGPQTMNTIDGVLRNSLQAEGEKRGYIVIGVAAPDGDLFFENGARIFPEFLKQMLVDYKVEGGKFHVAGQSNGGIAAFHVAAANPQYFVSVTAFPGYMWQPTPAKLNAIAKMCVFTFVGEHDEYRWHAEMQREVEYLRSTGAIARYTMDRGQPHRLQTLTGAGAARLFEGFEQARKGCRQ